MNRFAKYFSFLFLLVTFAAHGQIEDPVHWTWSKKKLGPNKYELTYTTKIDAGWHIYDLQPSVRKLEFPPIATTVVYDKKTKSSLTTKPLKAQTKPVVKYDEGFESDLRFHSGTVSFSQIVSLTKPVSKLAGIITYQACDDEKCIAPQDVAFSFDVDYTTSADAPAPQPEQLSPDYQAADKPDVDQSTVAAEELIWDIEIKPHEATEAAYQYEVLLTSHQADEDGMHKAYSLQNFVATFENPQVAVLDKDYEANRYTLLVQTPLDLELLVGEIAYNLSPDEDTTYTYAFSESLPEQEDEGAYVSAANNVEDKGLLPIFTSAFLFGLISLLTPCVFPMIPLTVSFFTKSDNKSKSVLQALLFGFFIIAIYVAAGYLLTLIAGPNTLNEMASNRIFNLIFFLVFVIFAISFFGAFEISLPSSWATKADAQAEKGGLLGVFFVAFTLVIVSFSCTGPIIGSLLVLAADGGGATGPVVGMLGFSLALALPFTIFAFFPSAMKKLPKSGGWLNAVKVTLGFLELALAFKFFVVPDQAYHWGILKREYFLALWIIIFALMGFYLLGKLRFSHDSPANHVSVPRLLLAIACFSFATYMVPGLWGAPVQMLSGLAPPWHDNEGFISSPASSVASTTDDWPDEVKPQKYTDILSPPFGLISYFDIDEAKRAAQVLKRPIIMDFTGHACTNCRKMEESVWRNPTIINMLNSEYILLQLYVDDRTDLQPSEVFYSSYLNSDITTIGKKWSEYQTRRFKTNSQPYYVITDARGRPLESVDPRGFAPATVESFHEFLKAGIDAYQGKADQTALALP